MRCLACETENLVTTLNCIACGMGLVGTRLGQALLEAEDLLGQARYRQASGQLNLAEAELSLARLDGPVQQLALARTMVDRARVHFSQGEHIAAADAAQRGLTLIPAATAAWWICTLAYNVLAGVAQYQEQLDDANRYIKLALAHAEQGSDHNILAMILNNKASQESDRGEFELALGTYQAALHHLELTALPDLRSLVNCNLVDVYFGLGEMQLALSHAEQAHEQAVVSSNRIRLCDSLKQLGRVYGYLGELQLARKWLLQALDEAKASSSTLVLAEVSCALAELSLLAGDYGLAQRYARQVLSGRSDDLREEVPALAIMVHSATWQGELDNAERNLRKMTERAKQRNIAEQNSTHYLVLTAHPIVQVAKGNWEGGVASFAEAIARLDASKRRYAQAQARFIYAKAVLWYGVKEYELARRVLLEAERCFGSIEAIGYQEQVGALLAALPVDSLLFLSLARKSRPPHQLVRWPGLFLHYADGRDSEGAGKRAAEARGRGRGRLGDVAQCLTHASAITLPAPPLRLGYPCG
jgi:tetratricopeptide (TPR) repeat protein